MKSESVNFEVPFLGLNSEKIGDRSIGRELADMLAVGQSEDPVKTITWAITLAKGDALQLDMSDKEKLKLIVRNAKNVTDLFKARVLELLA